MVDRRARPAYAGGWAGLLLLAVVGLGVVAMHGLGGHGLAAAASSSSSSSSASSSAMRSMAGLAGVDGPLGAASRSGSQATPMSEAPPAHLGGHLVELCLAVLLVGFALVLLPTAVIRSRCFLPRFPAVVRPSPDRDRDPPDLLALRVRRC